MRYDDARPHIATGDLIAVRRRSGWLAKATRLITESDYTHTGVALWVGPPGDRRLLMAHINGGGASLVPVSQESGFGFDVYASPVPADAIERAIWSTIGVRIAYSIADLFRIAAHIKLGTRLPQQGTEYICSALSAHLYLLAGWLPVNMPSIPWPGAIVAALATPPRLEVRP
jgi:hypothetical protein